MNRAERRATARRGHTGAAFGHAWGCGCTDRQVRVLETVACPCGARPPFTAGQVVPWPTGAQPGDVLTFEWGCRCDAEHTIRAAVL